MQQFLKGIAWQLESPEAIWTCRNCAAAVHTSNYPHLAEGFTRAQNYNRAALRCKPAIAS